MTSSKKPSGTPRVRSSLALYAICSLLWVAPCAAIACEPIEEPGLSQRDSEILARMRSEGVKSWTRMRDQFHSARFKGVDIRNWFTETEATPERVTNWALTIQGDNLLLALDDISKVPDTPPRPNQSVIGINGRYTFQLDRDDAQGAWNVSRLEVYAETPQPLVAGCRPLTENGRRRHAKTAALHYLVYANCATAIGVIPLSDLVVDPGLSVLSTRPVPGRKGLREIEFEYMPTKGSYQSFLPTPTRLRGGTMVLDSEHGWIIDSYRVQLAQSGGEKELFTAAVTYSSRGDAESMPLPQTLAITQGDPHDPPRFQLVRSIQFNEITFGTSADETFEITSYGLPAP